MFTLDEWSRGVAIESTESEDAFMYLWFYEWHMFEAVERGEHTSGSSDWLWTISEDKRSAFMKSDWLGLDAQAVEDGAELTLSITNKSDHDWPELAAIIPCFNPDSTGRGVPEKQTKVNTLFQDLEHTRTYYLGTSGLERQEQREIHFNEKFRPVLDGKSPEGKFEFSGKWPTSPKNAVAGIMIRESSDGKWVSGIAWEDFLSAQGHNPRKCMHLSVRVGPLKKDETKTVRGRIYLFDGDKDDCLKRFMEEFGG